VRTSPHSLNTNFAKANP